MIVSIHQPAYLPWLGYLSRIAESDIFVFLDSVQFEKNSYTNRNKIKTASGPLWLTIPVRLQGHLDKLLFEIEVDQSQPWLKKHLKSIEHSYRNAPDFSRKMALISDLYHRCDHVNFSNFCFEQLEFWLEQLDIKTKIIRSSSLGLNSRKSDLVLDICQSLGANSYLSGPFGRDYLDIGKFADVNIDLKFHEYKHPEYAQLHGDFIPAMGVIDFWFNCK